METEAPNRTYQRGQMEWALWQAMSHHNDADPRRATVPSVFANRIKRLLEIDATEKASIFGERASIGKGNATAYSEFGVFLMRLALELLDAGFKQSDVIYLLRHIKFDLEEEYLRVMEGPPILRAQLSAQARPKSPPRFDDPHLADTDVFMTVRKVEIKETWNPVNLPEPFILQPEFYYGRTELMKGLRLGFQNPATMLIQIADMAVYLKNWLELAPKIKRGRKVLLSADQEIKLGSG
jgi:hypothetical protein